MIFTVIPGLPSVGIECLAVCCGPALWVGGARNLVFRGYPNWGEGTPPAPVL